MAWVYLLIASMLEIAWTFSLKYMSMAALRKLRWQDLTTGSGWMTVAPFAGYVLFGVGNVVFFSMAMKEIPASTALAVWMGVTLIGVKLIEIMGFKEPFTAYQFLYIGLILVGIVGLKRGG